MNDGDPYRKQLARLATAMAAHTLRPLEGDLLPGDRSDLLKLFVEGNEDKRYAKLETQLELLVDAFPEFETLLRQYIRDVPLAPYATALTDANAFLEWLTTTQKPTSAQLDYVACQRARHKVLRLARKKHLAYARFVDLCSLSTQFTANLRREDPLLKIYLNPIMAWSRFRTHALLDEQADLPARVVTYPVDGEISTAILEPIAIDLIRELVTLSPCRIDVWAGVSRYADRESICDFCDHLAELKLVAFG